MNGYADNFEPILKTIKSKMKNWNVAQRVHLCEVLFKIWNQEKRVIKRSIMYDISWLSTEMTKVMLISMSYLVINFPYMDVNLDMKKNPTESFQLCFINVFPFYQCKKNCEVTTENMGQNDVTAIFTQIRPCWMANYRM